MTAQVSGGMPQPSHPDATSAAVMFAAVAIVTQPR